MTRYIKRPRHQYKWTETRNNKPFYTYTAKGKVDWLDRRNCQPFELCMIRYEDGSTQKVWWTGSEWDGLKPIKNMKILEWKPAPE